MRTNIGKIIDCPTGLGHKWQEYSDDKRKIGSLAFWKCEICHMEHVTLKFDDLYRVTTSCEDYLVMKIMKL